MKEGVKTKDDVPDTFMVSLVKFLQNLITICFGEDDAVMAQYSYTRNDRQIKVIWRRK